MHTCPGRLLCFVATFSLIAGCTTVTPRYRFSPVPAPDQFVTFSDGVPFVFSQRVHIVSVSLPPDGSALDADFSPIGISVANYDDRAHVIDAQGVQLVSDNPKLRIVPSSEIKDRINNRAAWARIANAFGAAANMAAASMPRTTTYSGTAYGSRGGYVGYAGSVVTNDPAATAIAQSAIRREQAEEDRDIERNRRTLIDEYSGGIRRHTLYPQDSYLGVVYVESRQLRHAAGLRLSITFGGETHTFAVDLGREGAGTQSYDYAAATPPAHPEPAAVSPAHPESAAAPEVFTSSQVDGAIHPNQRVTFETKDGRRFYAARIIEITPDYIIVSTLDGVFTLKKAELPDDLARALPLPAGSTQA